MLEDALPKTSITHNKTRQRTYSDCTKVLQIQPGSQAGKFRWRDDKHWRHYCWPNTTAHKPNYSSGQTYLADILFSNCKVSMLLFGFGYIMKEHKGSDKYGEWSNEIQSCWVTWASVQRPQKCRSYKNTQRWMSKRARFHSPGMCMFCLRHVWCWIHSTWISEQWFSSLQMHNVDQLTFATECRQ